jgi:heme A synthase
MVQRNKKMSRRSKALFWLAAVSVAVGAMIYLEQIPLLYVVATLVLVALLVVVGFSNLEKVGRES